MFFIFFSCYRSNLVGTRFTVFNNGVNPKKGGCMSDGSNIREEVAAIIYVSEVFVCLVFFIIIASKTHTEKKQKLHRINKVIKRKKNNKKTNSEFTHLHGNILTNIKIRYSSANSIYYCT